MHINIDMIYPIGSIYETTSSVSPNILFGGTWELYGAGRVTVCKDSSQTEFASIGQTGGSKYMQKHRHIGLSWLGDDTYQSITLNPGSSGTGYNISYTGGYVPGQQANIQTREAGSGNSQNLQPYIVVYRYRRTA